VHVEGDPRELALVELWVTAGEGVAAVLLGAGALLRRIDGRGDPQITERRASALLEQRGLGGLPAEAAEPLVLRAVVPDEVGPAGDAVTVGVLWVGQGEEGGLVDGGEQTEADQMGRDARRDQDVDRELAITELGEGVAGCPELLGGPVRVLDEDRLPLDGRRRLGGDAEDRERLKLPAVRWLGHGSPMRSLAGDAEPEQDGQEALPFLLWEPSTAILEMARRARRRVVERTEPVGPLCGRGGRDPVAIEEMVAEGELLASVEGEVLRGSREGFAGRVEHRRVAARELLAWLGREDGQRRVLGGAGRREDDEHADGAAHWRLSSRPSASAAATVEVATAWTASIAAAIFSRPPPSLSSKIA
jgi:hypothetical protein